MKESHQKKVSNFVENFFRIHLRPIRLFYGASRPQIKFLKSSLLCLFGRDFENRFKKIKNRRRKMEQIFYSKQVKCLGINFSTNIYS